jgi:MYXO-CTERM domain-containing protein
MFSSAALLAIAGTARAVPQFVQSVDTPHCDVQMPLSFVDELGLQAVFPAGERIQAFASPTTLSACPSHDSPNIPNVVVTMINLNPFTFTDVHYVADPAAAGAAGTTIGNEDGLVNAGQSFRIDNLGVNKPLVGESMGLNNNFEPGEVWRFVIDDYQNGLGLPASAFASIGVGAASPGGPSSGSIIAIVPEPASLGLAALAAPALLRRRRRAV